MPNSDRGGGDERLKAIYARTVAKLKEVVHEFKITQEELHIAGDYLNRLGKSGFSRSLLDVALAMTSVDATARMPNATRPNLEGPFHRKHAIRSDGNLVLTDMGDQPLLELSGCVRDAATGKSLPGAEVDVWQADNEGHYDFKSNLRGIVVADAHGRYLLNTIVPRDYSDHDNDPIGELYRAMGRHNRRAAHIHVKIRYKSQVLLTTQLFVPNSPYLDSDYVEGAVTADLIMQMKSATTPGGAKRFQARFDFAVAVPGHLTAA